MLYTLMFVSFDYTLDGITYIKFNLKLSNYFNIEMHLQAFIENQQPIYKQEADYHSPVSVGPSIP